MMGRRALCLLLLAATAITAFTAGSVTTAASRAPSTTPEKVPFQIIQRTGLGLCNKPCYKVFTSQRALDRFFSKFPGPGLKVDFARSALIAVGWGVTGSCCFTITVDRVVRVGDRLQVYVRRGLPFPIAYSMGTSPWALVEVSKPFRTVQFIIRTDRYRCGFELSQLCETTNAGQEWPAAFVPPTIPCTSKTPITDPSLVLCSPPVSVRKEESFIHPAPVDPTDAVSQLTHLQLRQVIDAVWAESPPNHYAPHAIFYLYGTPPSTLDHLNLSRRTPSFVVVLEEVPNYFAEESIPPKSPPRLEQLLIHLGANTYTEPISTGTISKGPWELVGGLPRHNLGVDIVADGKRSMVRSLGLRILHALDGG